MCGLNEMQADQFNIRDAIALKLTTQIPLLMVGLVNLRRYLFFFREMLWKKFRI